MTRKQDQLDQHMIASPAFYAEYRKAIADLASRGNAQAILIVVADAAAAHMFAYSRRDR